MKVGIIGVGNMGGAIAKGLLNNPNFNNPSLYLYNRTPAKIEEFKRMTNICQSTEEVINNAQIIILGIKPNEYEKWLETYSPLIQEKLFICIGAGITSEFLKKYISLFVLTMPNIGSEFNMGYTVLCKNPTLNPFMEEIILEEACKLLSCIGKVKVIEEDQIEDYIGMIGSSPAYFFEIIKAMASTYKERGYEVQEVEQIFAYIMEMTANIIQNKKEVEAEELVQSVCSKGGATIEAINSFREDKLDLVLKTGIEKCMQRAYEMKNNK